MRIDLLKPKFVIVNKFVLPLLNYFIINRISINKLKLKYKIKKLNLFSKNSLSQAESLENSRS